MCICDRYMQALRYVMGLTDSEELLEYRMGFELVYHMRINLPGHGREAEDEAKRGRRPEQDEKMYIANKDAMLDANGTSTVYTKPQPILEKSSCTPRRPLSCLRLTATSARRFAAR